MIRARVFSGTGQRVLDVILPSLRKRDVADRLAKSGGDGVALDSAIPFDTVLRLLPRSAIEQAGLQRLKEVEPGSSEYRFWMNALENLTALLQGSVQAWTCAQGSDMALGAGDRFGVGRGHVGEPEGHVRVPHEGLAAVPMHRDPKEDEADKWARRADEARAAARERGWRTTSMTGETMFLHHPRRPGEELVIRGAGAWSHSGRDIRKAEGPWDELSAHLDSETAA